MNREQAKEELGGFIPYWIVVDDGDTFEGHQGHWADCFASNATIEAIDFMLSTSVLFIDSGWSVRTMTDEELEKYPEVVEFCKGLRLKYGEI